MSSKICSMSMVPLRKEPNHRSEMISQIVFGESAKELEATPEWIKIKMNFDNYEGWVEKGSLDDHTGKLHGIIHIVNNTFLPAQYNGSKILLPAGSELEMGSESNTFYLAQKEVKLLDQTKTFKKDQSMKQTAELFLHAPYLWGGRTAMGIDCSGLIQIVFKIHGIQLARDASDQVLPGKKVPAICDAQIGDLMFFHDEQGKVIHVGFYIGEGSILHASKKVRIDAIDDKGIFNRELSMYTHYLHSIKRIPIS